MRRLGRNEVQLVQDMYDGVKAMIQAENAISDDDAGVMGSHLATHNDIGDSLPKFPAGTTSLLSKLLTQDVWDQIKDKEDKFGFSFKQAIFSGCKNTDSGIGVYAGSHDSYTAFAPLLDKVIEEYHGHDKNAKHIFDMDYKNLNCPPFTEEEDKMIISTRIRVARNMAEYPLGPGVTKAQRIEIEGHVTKATGKFEGELSGKYFSLETMSADDQK